MGFNLAPSELLMDRIMCNLMRYGIPEVKRHICRKYPWIEAQTLATAFVTIHSRGSTREIKARFYRAQGDFK